MKIWAISDTHGYHNLLDIPSGIDLVIFSGDCANYKDIARNSVEVADFLYWMQDLPIKYKIMIAGNHDTSIENGFISRANIESHGIIYLYNESVQLWGTYNIWGSPFTPTFGNWAFMKSRGKLAPLWETIPEDLDILVTHGPPIGVLDLSLNSDNSLDRCGCSELWNEVVKKKPKYHLFGHIHNVRDKNRHMIRNQGILKFPDIGTVFMNSSIVEDGKYGILTNHGQIFEI